MDGVWTAAQRAPPPGEGTRMTRAQLERRRRLMAATCPIGGLPTREMLAHVEHIAALVEEFLRKRRAA